MKKRSLTLSAAFLALLFIFSYILPAANVLAHDRHHGEEMVDIIVRYYDKDLIPNEEDLDPSFEDIRTSERRPVQSMSVPASAVKELVEDEAVEHIRYNQEVSTSESERQLNAQDWNNDRVNAFDAWDEGITGEGVNVAVIDTGFHESHDDINFTGGVSIFNDEPWNEDHSGHGTHVAGIIGANEGTTHQGIAPGVNLYGVKIYEEDNIDSNGSASTDVDNLIEGFLAARELNPNIIVISSGFTDGDSELHGYIQEAVSSGVLVVAASGNGQSSVDYPAAYEEVISVTSITQEGANAHDAIFGAENELAAPGVSIGGLWNDGGYHTTSGSSQAAPHVAGVAALTMQKHGLSGQPLRQQLQEDAEYLGTPEYFGHGLVQYVPDDTEEPDDPDDSEEDDDPEEPSDEEESTEEQPDDEQETSSEDEESTEMEASQPSQPDSPSEQETNENDEESESQEENEEASENEEDSEDDDDEDNDEDTSSAVWVRPNNSNGIATVDNSHLDSVSSGGTLAISFDSSLDHLTHFTLTAEQIADIRERDITVLIAKTDIEWVIPSENFEEGEATLTFQHPEEDLPRVDDSTSSPYQFSLSQDGEQRLDFPEEMIYRFFVEAPEENGEVLYEWIAEEDAWSEFGNSYSNGAVVGSAIYTGTFSVFHPDVISADDRNIISADRLDGALVDEEGNDIEAESAGLFDDPNRLILSLTGILVIGGSLGGGFYYFGKNKSE